MQNGAIGEARTRAFLLDRFWVLERSVDIQGADLIIQRRLTTQNLIDREPPRLGVIQVKFFGTAGTTHYVHKQYVVHASGSARTEFFLMCHAGTEDSPRSWLLSADEIKSSFPEAQDKEQVYYQISFQALEKASRFEVCKRSLALDRIEHALGLADFLSNRRFISGFLPSVSQTVDGILPLYHEPIRNVWLNIPEQFAKIKKSAMKGIIDLEEAREMLQSIINEVDPIKAQAVAEDMQSAYAGGYGRFSVSLPDDLWDEDFITACRRHKKMVDRLRADGVLDAFIVLSAELKRSIVEFLRPLFPFRGEKTWLRGKFRYDPVTFAYGGFEADVINAADVPAADSESFWEESERISIETAGVLNLCWRHSNMGAWKVDTKAEDREYADFADAEFQFYVRCMDRIYEARYGDPDE